MHVIDIRELKKVTKVDIKSINVLRLYQKRGGSKW